MLAGSHLCEQSLSGINVLSSERNAYYRRTIGILQRACQERSITHSNVQNIQIWVMLERVGVINLAEIIISRQNVVGSLVQS